MLEWVNVKPFRFFCPYFADVFVRGANIHYRQDSALVAAVIGNHIEIVRDLLEHGADVHAQGEEPLIRPAVFGHAEIVRLLPANGADAHAWKDAALFRAVEYGHLDTVQVLLEDEACVDGPRGNLESVARNNGSDQIATLLSQHRQTAGSSPACVPEL